MSSLLNNPCIWVVWQVSTTNTERANTEEFPSNNSGLQTSNSNIFHKWTLFKTKKIKWREHF